MNDQLNESGQLSHSQDGCQTNSRRYDSFTTGPVRPATLATAGLLVNILSLNYSQGNSVCACHRATSHELPHQPTAILRCRQKKQFWPKNFWQSDDHLRDDML